MKVDLYLKYISIIVGLGFSYSVKAQIPKVIISEINYKSCNSFNGNVNDRAPDDWLELWNYGETTVDISNWVLQGERPNEFYLIPQNIHIKPDERLVFARFDQKFKEVHPDIPHIGPFLFRLSGKGQHVRLYDQDHILLHEVLYRDSLPWPKAPDGYGKTLELIDPEGDINDGKNWMAGCIYGSPGKPTSECPQKIVFSEISSSSMEPHDAGDWVEIRNISNETLDISKWIFKNRRDSNVFVFPAKTIIEPGENIVLNRRNKFHREHIDVRALGPFEFGIRSHREILRLYDDTGLLYNSMFYHNEKPWPTKHGTHSVTMELVDHAKSLCLAENWIDGCFGGTPGEYYDPGCDKVSVENITKTQANIKLYPNPFSTSATLEVETPQTGTSEISFQIFDFTGQSTGVNEIYSIQELDPTNSGNMKVVFKRKNLAPGIYFYRLTQSNNILSSGKMMIID